ncbi:hypothetical protein YC2023_050034 [Brassica napus]
MGATSRSDAMRSLQTTSQSDLARATPRSRSPFHPGGSRKLTRSDLSERPLQVAPEAHSDLARVTPRAIGGWISFVLKKTTKNLGKGDLFDSLITCSTYTSPKTFVVKGSKIANRLVSNDCFHIIQPKTFDV